VRRLILLVGRRGGKDRFESAVAVWRAALCLDWKKYISAGEGAVLLIGTDKKQANILHRYCHGLIEASPRLAAEVTRETEEWLEFKSGGSVQIITNDEGLARGRSAIAVIGTEVCQWQTDDMSPSHDAEVVEAAVASMGMCRDVPGGLLILGSSVYRKKGLMYRRFKELHGNSSTNDICWFAPSQVMNPALPQSVIDEALAGDRAKNSAEYLNVWREDISDLVPVELLEECTDFDVFERPYQRGISYTAHCDMASGLGSGVSHSSAAFSIAHRDFAKGLQIQDVVREVKAPFVPEVVVKEFAELAKRYNIRTVYADQWGFGLHQSLWNGTKTGIRLVEAKYGTSENYLRFMSSLLAGKIRLVNNKRERDQFAALERHVVSGNEIVQKPKTVTVRDDVATAAAGALVAAGDGTGYLTDYSLWAD
jgi:hypothetical protein